MASDEPTYEYPPGHFRFQDSLIPPGRAMAIDIPVSRVSSGQTVTMPVRILNGRRPGPALFVSAAIHGDEIVGVEIVRRILDMMLPETLAGTLICVPIVNVYGFVANSRYLPDRRDLNRSFPGSPTGPLASRLACIFRSEIIARADFGIDLHSAAMHRFNLPQVRISPDSPQAEAMAEVFAAPATIVSPLREKSLRWNALEMGVEMLLYEAGEALRFDEGAISTGVDGIQRVMQALGMIEEAPAAPQPTACSSRTLWLRAPSGGVCRLEARSGDFVADGQCVARIAAPAGEDERTLESPIAGIVIGHADLPIVNQGDALMHIAELQPKETGAPRPPGVEPMLSNYLLDEDEVI